VKRSTKNRIITIFLLLIFLGSTAAFSLLSAFRNEQQNIEGWRARIAIVIFEEVYPIPANIGIVDNETKAKVFTTDSNGFISKSVSEDITLKDFFDIWGQNFNSTCILDYCNSGNNSMVMYVNGNENSDYELYAIKNNDMIVIDYR
jgi:hypothetical protein